MEELRGRNPILAGTWRHERNPKATAGDVKGRAQQKLTDLEERIRSLQRMRRALRKVMEQCSGSGPTSSCSILRSLDD